VLLLAALQEYYLCHVTSPSTANGRCEQGLAQWYRAARSATNSHSHDYHIDLKIYITAFETEENFATKDLFLQKHQDEKVYLIFSLPCWTIKKHQQTTHFSRNFLKIDDVWTSTTTGNS